MSAAKTLGFVADAPESEENERRERMMRALRSTFRPEFLNRVDEVIVFNSLSREDIAEIARLMLGDVSERCKNIGISLSFSPAVAELLAEKGFDQSYGARPLRRAIVRLVEDGFSGAMLEGKVKAGDTVVAVAKDGVITFEKRETPDTGEENEQKCESSDTPEGEDEAK